MSQISKHFINPKISTKVNEIFTNAIKNSRSKNEVVAFLDDLLSPVEKSMLAKRLAIAYMLLENKYTYREISKTLKVSLGTIAKVHSTFALNRGGYKKIVSSLGKNKKIIKLLSEFLSLLTPVKYTLTGEKYLNLEIENRKEHPDPF